jgi:hypothetical protein
MSQATFGDDDLFGEAADEIRDDVEAALDEARASLPAADDIWETDADNTLGVLNGLRSALDTGDAAEHLRDAKKWYTVGERADAFDEPEELEAEIETVEELLDTIADAHDDVADLASTVPELRGELEDAAEAAAADEADEADDAAETTDATDADAADADD